jgi:hypothetical protein
MRYPTRIYCISKACLLRHAASICNSGTVSGVWHIAKPCARQSSSLLYVRNQDGDFQLVPELLHCLWPHFDFQSVLQRFSNWSVFLSPYLTKRPGLARRHACFSVVLSGMHSNISTQNLLCDCPHRGNDLLKNR